jgi:hypothetical protein
MFAESLPSNERLLWLSGVMSQYYSTFEVIIEISYTALNVNLGGGGGRPKISPAWVYFIQGFRKAHKSHFRVSVLVRRRRRDGCSRDVFPLGRIGWTERCFCFLWCCVSVGVETWRRGCLQCDPVSASLALSTHPPTHMLSDTEAACARSHETTHEATLLAFCPGRCRFAWICYEGIKLHWWPQTHFDFFEWPSCTRNLKRNSTELSETVHRKGPPLWSSDQEFLATDTEVPGSIPGAPRFCEK